MKQDDIVAALVGGDVPAFPGIESTRKGSKASGGKTERDAFLYGVIGQMIDNKVLSTQLGKGGGTFRTGHGSTTARNCPQKRLQLASAKLIRKRT